MHPHRLADTLEELLANGTELSRAERRALLYPLAAHSPTIHLWLRWTNAFTPAFTIALLLLLAGIATWRTGWQALLILAATRPTPTSLHMAHGPPSTTRSRRNLVSRRRWIDDRRARPR